MSKFPPRLLIILNRFVIGGQAVDTLPLAFFLQNHFQILILYGQKEKDEIEANFLLNDFPGLQLKKISFLKRSINPFVDLVAFFQLLGIMVRFKPAIVHTHGAKSGVLGRVAAFLCRVPVIVHTFHGHLFHSYFNSGISSGLKYVERTLARITNGFIALSSSQFNDLVNRFKIVPVQKCRIIPLGLVTPHNVDKLQARDAFRTRYNVAPTEVAIGIVGRIVPIKNHRLFVEIIQKMLAANPLQKLAFFVVGDGELKQQVEEHLRFLNIPFGQTISPACRVALTSWLPNISQVMCGLDIVALTSLNEGTPLSLLEAQAFGKPVVATNVGGVKDSMLDGVSGFLVALEDTAGFTAKLSLLVEDATLRGSMGQAGSNFVEANFSKTREVGHTREFYFSLLAKKGIVPAADV